MKRMTFTSRQRRLLPPRTICLGLLDEARTGSISMRRVMSSMRNKSCITASMLLAIIFSFAGVSQAADYAWIATGAMTASMRAGNPTWW
jgi:hypothetical protein